MARWWAGEQQNSRDGALDQCDQHLVAQGFNEPERAIALEKLKAHLDEINARNLGKLVEDFNDRRTVETLQ
ncbi:MAG TPA: hypothetical protein VLD36_03970 [Burkholderiales bacterium]|nr:hypothetical protein [Burkholderiales bacterium]